MAIQIVGAGRPFARGGAASAWRWLWRGWLAMTHALRAQQPEPEPTAARAEAAGECPAFSDLFTRYHLALIDYLYGMTRDRELAADLAQDAFMRAYTAAPDLAGIAQPRAWLYRIATHVALNASRRQRRFEWLSLSRIEPQAGMDASAAAGAAWSMLPPVEIPQSQEDLGASVAERDAVWTVLGALPPRWRAILLLQATAGFAVPEIAAQLHLSEANVRKVLFRAKERFRMLYRELDAEGAAR
ncbi:MAG TPA: RNA polymerase sigma factor [Ktedonobacterales bacterium]|nr:RNA polymerase sigma factor [Ktedonobacterales bacterium]